MGLSNFLSMKVIWPTRNENILRISYIMSINKLPGIKKVIGNMDISLVTSALEMLWLDWNLKTFYKISIFRTTKYQKDDKSDKVYKFRSLTNHFNKIFSNSVSNYDFESIDEDMAKFKCQSSVKQYARNKTIKWAFNFWYRCANETGFSCTWAKRKAQKKIWYQLLFWIWLNLFKILNVCIFLIISSTVLRL